MERKVDTLKNENLNLKPFSLEFYLRDTVEVARRLIGAYLVRSTGDYERVGRIVETEAYRENDPASHSFRGPTRRTLPMFEAGGIAYVYFIYGMHNCFNVVTEPEGTGCAVLIRALEVVKNTEIMWGNRFPGKSFDPAVLRSIANGPGKLCRAMDITREHNGSPLSYGPLQVLRNPIAPPPVVSVSQRMGVKKGVEMPWRFFDAESDSVSR
jgi:DNA-3-methyladenine glycosylase